MKRRRGGENLFDDEHDTKRRKKTSFEDEQEALFDAIAALSYSRVGAILDYYEQDDNEDYNRKLINTEPHYRHLKATPFHEAISLYVSKVGDVLRDKENDFYQNELGALYNIIELLLQYGADVKSRRHNNTALYIVIGAWNALMQVAPERHKNIVQLLLDYDANINQKNDCQKNVLHQAILMKWTHIIPYLIEKGADIQAVDEDDNMLLHEAAECLDYEGIKYFVDKGLDLYAKNRYDRTPLHNFCARYLENIDGQEIVRHLKLLIGDGWHVNWKCKNNGQRGLTPLMLLFSLRGKRHREPMEFLISKGADIFIKNNRGWDMLNWACKDEIKDLDIIEYLLFLGANPNTLDREDITLLSDLEIVAFIQEGDNYDTINKLVKMLIEHGINVNLCTPFYKIFSQYKEGLLDILGVPEEQILHYLKTLFINGAQVNIDELNHEKLGYHLNKSTELIRENHRTFRQTKQLLKSRKIEDIKRAVPKLKTSMMQDCISPYERLMVLSKIVAVSKTFGQEFIPKSEILGRYLKRIPFNYDFFRNEECKELRSLVISAGAGVKDKFNRSMQEAQAGKYPKRTKIII